MTKLSPCPFCNRQLEHDTKIEATRHPKIPYEEYCPLAGFSFASDRTDIISAWNRRTDPAAIPMEAKAILLDLASKFRKEHSRVFSGNNVASELARAADALPAAAATPTREAVIAECAALCDGLRRKDYSSESADWTAGTLDCATAIRSLVPRPEPAATPPSPDDDWEERGAADELRKAVIEECIAAIDKFVGKGSVVAFRVRATLEATPVSRLKEQP